MAGYQFAHVSTFSLKGNSASRSANDILMESTREVGHCDHVANPLSEILLFGCSPREIMPKIERRIAAAKKGLKGTNKRIQKNTHILEGAVFSHPYVPTDLHDPKKNSEYLAWRNAQYEFAIKEAKNRGMEVLSVVEHRDEAHLHIHVLSIPYLTKENPRLDAKACHLGHIAQKAAKYKGLQAKDQIKAYRAAMSGWQDTHHTSVGQHHSLTRIGPKRDRLSRSEWHDSKDAARLNKQRLEREAELKVNLNNLKSELGDLKKIRLYIENMTSENENLEEKCLKLTSEIESLTLNLNSVERNHNANTKD